VNQFSSKYDYYLAGKVKLTEQEMRGLKIFEDEDKGNCAACHPSALGDDGASPLFTDFTFDNLGVAKNFNSPFLSLDKQFNPQQKAYIDKGLGAITGNTAENGLFKVPTLRNIAVTAPYMHNGLFTSLEDVINFYNTRDSDDKWGQPEVKENVNDEELGDLKLTEEEVQDLLAFLKTLTDGYQP
jgi:cytochrome c peroxidase